MTMKRSGAGWIPADEYGRSLPTFTVNLLVKNVARSVSFYRDVLSVTVRHADEDFAALQIQGVDFLLHADHTYDHHPLYERLKPQGPRGRGAELRVMGIDPDAVEARAARAGATIVQQPRNFPHGWRDVMVEDPDGYVWAVGIAIEPQR
jgi:uncharacterized glyoxalase superfamily protein PhnB